MKLQTIAALVQTAPELEGLYLSVDNEPYMRLVIEHIGEGPSGRPAISCAHYFELNGDLCQDPEVCFEVETTSTGVLDFTPFSFQMALPPVYQEAEPAAQQERH